MHIVSGIEVKQKFQGSLIIVLSVKDEKGYDELFGLCQTGEIVDLVLDDNARKECVKSGKESLFRLSLCETEDEKSGTLTTLLGFKTIYKGAEQLLCRSINDQVFNSPQHR